MTSLAKIAANRSNARKSTGPKTANGKSRSRFNAVKSGIYAVHRPLLGEDQKAYRRLSRRLRKRYQPRDPVEELLVDQILGHIWRIGRLERAEKAYLQAIHETRCQRRGQMELQLNALISKEEEHSQDISRYQILAGARLSPGRQYYEGEDFDGLGKTLLEASISREEARPIADLRTQRSILLDEVLWLEESLRKQKRLAKIQIPRSNSW